MAYFDPDNQISFFPHLKAKKPSGKITLKKWATEISSLYKPIVDAVRQSVEDGKPKAVRDKLKLKSPCATTAGVFSKAGDRFLVNHSYSLALDLDYCNTYQAKSILGELPYVYYAGLSISGLGVVAYVHIESPVHHLEHFEALRSELNKYGLKVDKSGSNIGRKRFYSYDMDPFVNEFPIPYTDRLKLPPPSIPLSPPAPDQGNAWAKVELICQAVERTATDITKGQINWIKIGGTLVNLFGEHGRPFYHRLSQYHPFYNEYETDTKYNYLQLHPKPYGLGMLFHICKQHGIYLKNLKST